MAMGDRTPTSENEKASSLNKHDEDAEMQTQHQLDLTKPNTSGRIVNPLAGVPRDQLLRDVDDFMAEKGIPESDREYFHKGAIAAQSPGQHAQLDAFDDTDRAALDREIKSKWSHPMMLYWTIFICSVGAATQGWDQTGSNGANLSFPTEFGIGEAAGERGEWLVGLVNSAPYISSAFFGCWLSDPLNNLFGRRGVIFITALILIATPIASGFTHSWGALFAVRMVLGLGMGAKGATVPLLAAENSPSAIRGALTMSWQLWTAFGIFIGFCANAVVADVGKIAWRLQLGSAFIPALPLALGIFFVPESPRWLMKKQRYSDAYNSLIRLRFTKLQAARDLYFIHVQLKEESKIITAENYFKRFSNLFAVPRVRRATVAITVVMIAQQMCGINIMSFYSSTIFVEAGTTAKQALYASIGFGAINFVCAIPAVFIIDKIGRRSLLLITFPIMAICLLCAGFGFLAPNEIVNGESQATKGKLAIIALFIYLFTAAYSIGEGPVPFVYSAEAAPLANREVAMAYGVATTLFWASVLGLTFPRMLRALGSLGSFGFYAGLNMVAFVLIFHFVPETARFSLEELDQVFNIPTGTFIKHEYKAAGHLFSKVVLRSKAPGPEPLVKQV